MSALTEGPWEALGNLARTTYGLGNPEARGLLVAECPGHTEESNTNARHIAALPELLAVAERVLEVADIYMDSELLVAASQAIAKTKGNKQ